MIKINPFTRLFVLSLFLILGITHSYAYTVTIRAEKFGTVEPSGPQTIPNEGLQVTAEPYEGYAFSNWGVTDGVVATPNSHATTTITATKNGTVTAYFKEALHTVKIQSNNTDYGRVSHPSTSVGQINASSEITATANPGYRFTGWTVFAGGDNITILNPENTITRIKAKGAGTIQANFEATTDIDIYFRPNTYWTRGQGAKFAIKYWEEETESGWVEMSQVQNNTTYYKATIRRAATELVFGRFDPTTPDCSSATPWNKIAAIPMPTDGKNLFDLRVHLKPDIDARWVAYFYEPTGSGNDGAGTYKWIEMTDSDGDGIYTCDIPHMQGFDASSTNYYNKVMFCRMKGGTTNNNWSNVEYSTAGLSCNALYMDAVPNNLYTLADSEWSVFWETYEAPTYPVTLYASKFGPYGFMHNDIQYFSPVSGSITYDIPKGDTVTLFSTPYNEAYYGDIMIRQGDNRFEIRPESGDPILEISSATILDDNYKTKDTHTVYLAMPKSTWYNYPGDNYLCAYHSRSNDTVRVEMVLKGSVGDSVYYSCEVPAGNNTIHFEKRKSEGSFVSSDFKTISLVYDIPLSSINCYILGGRRPKKDEFGNTMTDGEGNTIGDPHQYEGLWDGVPGFEGDCRLVYTKDGKEYYSDIIRAGIKEQIVSLHIAESTENASLRLEKLGETDWELIDSKSIADIDVIANNNIGGVWTFKIEIDDSGNPSIDDYENDVQLYNGNYYIRTNNAEGGWRNYTLSTNLMTRSSYEGSGYTHYFCRWIDIIPGSKTPGHNNNVKFIIANDYGAVISTEMAEDTYTAPGGILPESANVRWTWDEQTNELSRAYILNSTEDNNLIAAYTNTNNNNSKLAEQKSWIYEKDLTEITKGSALNTLIATYPSKNTEVSYQDGNTTKTETINSQQQPSFITDPITMLTSDETNTNTYTVRVIYDFKINKTMVMIIPDKEYDANVGIDVLLDRTDQEEATQVKSTITKAGEFNIYATMTFTKEHLEDLNKTEWERLYYWISFPFDVRISDVFGFGDYGKHWIIEYYDGKSRAENGYWTDGPSYWRWVSDTTGTKGILKANQGYVLALNRGIANMGVFEDSEIARLYFPSINTIEQIDGNMQNVPVTLEAYTCNIEEDNRKVYDSNWHMIGAPSYANKTQTLTQSDVFFYYEYITDDNTYRVTSTQNEEVKFKSLHSYMVQYAGTITWQTWTLTPPASVAARKNADSEKDSYSFRLELQQTATNKMDQTFITMQPEGATEAFDLNKDLTKMLSSGTNIYTLAGEEKIQLAGSVLPTAKTTIPVGVQVNTTGEYTFSMPDGTDGVSVTLVDNQTGVHTNMLLDNYTTTINAGTSESRFFLVIDPQSTSTAVDNINGDTNTDTQKYLIDNQLIIRTANGIYDAQGRKR